MDVQTGLVYVGVVVISAAVILLVSMFGIKEKSYEEAIAEQRKLPHDLLLGKKDKSKEKKHKNKAGKKVKEKKEEKDEKEDKEEKPEHVQFEENPQILPVEPLLRKENLHQLSQSESVVNKSPKETPTKSKKNAKDAIKKKDETVKEEKKEEKKETVNVSTPTAVAPKESGKDSGKEFAKESKETKEAKESKDTKDGKDAKDNKEAKSEKEGKDVKEQQKETPVKDAKEIFKENAPSVQTSIKESKKAKKKNDILAQIGGEKDAVNMSLLTLFIQKAELSRSEIQILIDQLLNKQLDNPSEHSEWTEGRADPVIKLKKQLAEKEKALADEHEASIAFQNKLKELRAELNSERSRLTASVRQLEEALNAKATEAQTLHTRMQHILESHAAEKQGFARQIEQLQSKVNEEAAIIHKMQEDQGQAQGHLQQELIAQRKQMEVQFAQMCENENALKTQLAQKHVETQELQNQLQATCDSRTAEVDVLRQQIGLMQEELMHSQGQLQQLQHYKEASDRLQEVALKLEDSLRAQGDLEHRLKAAHRHEQDLQKQVNSLQAELNVVKNEASEVSALKSELAKAQAEIMKLKSELSASLTEAKNEATEITALKATLAAKNEELNKFSHEYNLIRAELQQSAANVVQLESQLSSTQNELDTAKAEVGKTSESLKQARSEASNYQADVQKLRNDLQTDLEIARSLLVSANETASEVTVLKDRLQSNEKKSSEVQLQVAQLQEENDRLSAQIAKVTELQAEVKRLHEENESLASQLAATTERPAVEGRENGIEEKTQDHVQLEEHANSLALQVTALKNDLISKEEQLSQVTAKVDALKNDVNVQHDLARRLREDLETQKLKNNEIAQKVRLEQEELTKAFLQRIFPEIKVSEKSHDQWLNAFEEKIQAVLTELRRKAAVEAHPDLVKQNKNLQDMVLHYKQIIEDTESILHKLQNHVESEETRWQSQLQQKENEITSLRVEVNELVNKLEEKEKLQISITALQQKTRDLEARLAEAKSHSERVNGELLELRSKAKTVSSGNHTNDLATLEKLQEEKARLSEELKTECNKRATLDAEVLKLRSLVETSESSLAQEKCLVTQLQQEVSQLKNEICGGCSSSEQSMLNGPPTSESPKSEPPLAAQTLIAALENTLLKNTEFANCSITKPINLVQSQQEIDSSPLTTKYSSKSCHMTDHNTQASWNPLIGQQHKKHKKKRKGGSGKK